MNTPSSPELSGFDRLTTNAKQVVVAAHQLALENAHAQILPLHIFISLISSPSGLVKKVFEQQGIDLNITKEQLKLELRKLPRTKVKYPKFSPAVKALINDSFLKSQQLGHVYVGTEHLLLALLEVRDELFVSELNALGLTPGQVSKSIASLGSYWPGILSQTDGQVSGGFRPEYGDEDGEEDTPFFARSMNSQAESGEFLEITGRDKEIDRLIHILARKTKNNPILVGDAGVGKTAVVQGFVQRIMRGQVPPSFVGKEVLSLDIASMMAGAKVRGDLEERILAVINDVIEQGDKIIFIDEIHMIVGAGGQAHDAMDIANILKPYLTDPRLRIIGATTVNEYRRYFDADAALSRRFQPIDVDELDRDSALSIMRNLRKQFEDYHGVKIKDEALVAAVNLSSKFISDRFLPDKAIDVIDEAAASLKIGREVKLEPELNKLDQQLAKVREGKQEAILSGDLQKAFRLKQKEEKLSEEIVKLMSGKRPGQPKDKAVDEALVESVVVQWTKIPLAAASMDKKKLKDLRPRIRSRIVGQEHILDSVVDTLRRSHLALGNHNRPLASFLFLGPTGVGKTELSKAIAKELFGSENMLVQLNMSEYMEMHSVAKLIGSPPGYVGYQEGGQLTEQIRRRPYSVVLFDEIEKAHPEVLNLLLQILEEGQLQDGRGRKSSFRNTVVILTSNIGAEQVAKDRKLGFNIDLEQTAEQELEEAFSEMRDRLLEALRDEVRPEILNRLDEIAVFRGLNEKDCLEITQMLVNNFAGSLLEKNIVLTTPKPVIKFINQEGYSAEYGARNIRRKIQQLLESPLATYILDHGLASTKRGSLHLRAKLENEKIVFQTT